jgi:hypothetical protein
MRQAITVHYDPKLMEEAVFHLQRDSYVAKDLDERRRCLYEVAELEQRELLFQDLYREWFARFGLSNVIDRALAEQPIIAEFVSDCYVGCAARADEEGAELFVARDQTPEKTLRRTLRILIRPESLLQPESAAALLRRELYHIADMVDPAFAYQPALPGADDGPYRTLITSRYRVLWNISISGRMIRRGWLPGAARNQAFAAFCRVFPMLKEGWEKYFQLFFNADQPSHGTLTAYAVDPREAAGFNAPGAATTHCPLCRFPTLGFEPQPAQLAGHVLAAIASDFPDWSPDRGLCVQCADLYRARRVSAEAANALPGWNSRASTHSEDANGKNPATPVAA